MRYTLHELVRQYAAEHLAADPEEQAAAEARHTAYYAGLLRRSIDSQTGMNADLLIDAQGRTHMIYDAGQRGVLGEVWCGAACTSAGAWQRRILETNEQLMQEFTPASPLSCSLQDAKFVARCFYYDPSDPTHKIYTRVERVWWAVRWAQFPRL